MIRAMFIAASGMAAQQLNIDVISNNLANVNTVGFKKSRPDFQDLLSQEIKTPGAISGPGTQVPTGIQLGSGVRSVSVQKIFSQGDFQNTQTELDLAIEGDGFFQVTQPDGTLAYTRNGSFKRDRDGRMVTPDGFPLEPAITIPSDALRLTISQDGTVTAIQAGSSTPSQIGNIEMARFVNPSGLISIGRNLYLPSGASGDPNLGVPGQNGVGTIAQGFLESSNVDIASELVNMIIGQRAYEINSKAIQTADEMLQFANSIKR